MDTDGYVLSFVMAGGQGSRLGILTRDRSKPAVGILGHYRILDFVATNIANTGIHNVIIASQFEPRSLNRHIGNGSIWGFDGIDKRVEIVHPYQEGGSFVVFDGTADSIRKNSARINSYNPDILLVLGGDHIYAADYKDLIEQHKRFNADITIMTNVIPEDKVGDFGIVKINESGRIIDFAEKPKDKELIESFGLPPRVKEHLGINDPDLNFLASMGNYVFFWDRLGELLDLSGADFGEHVIPAIRERQGDLYAYVFNGYWRDVGKIKDYFDCNMEFTSEKPPLDLTEQRVRTYERNLPGAVVASDTSIQNVTLSSGDVIHRGSKVTNSVLGYQVIIEEKCNVDHCILLGADRNEYEDNRIRRRYTTHIGKNSNLSYVIVDKNVWIGDNVDIGPHNGSPEERREILKSIGLKPYRKLDDDTTEGDFDIELETGILVIGKQRIADPKEPIIPDNMKC